MRVLAVDPGYTQSAIVVFDGRLITRHATVENATLLQQFSERDYGQATDDTLVIEQIAAMGMAVGEEVFETVFWSGRFAEAWSRYSRPYDRIKRHAIKMHLCGHPRAKDPNVRQALLDRFGPGKEKALGTKKAPGALYGIKGDEWAALAVAVTWWDQQLSKGRVA